MINQQNFVEYDLPVLYKIMTIKQPIDDISLQFWNHIVELYETQVRKQQEITKDNKKMQVMSKTERQQSLQKVEMKSVQLLFAKGKQGMLVIWRFENNALMSQKSIKIPYFLTKEITMIKAIRIKEKPKMGEQKIGGSSRSFYTNTNRQLGNKFDILMLGYIDGTLQIFEIQLGQTSINLNKCLQVKNLNSEPVTNVEIYDHSELFVCRTHSIFMYPKLVVELANKIATKSKDKLNCSQNLLKVKQLYDSSKLSITLANDNLHIYNEIEGLFTFQLPEMKSEGSILDSIKYFQQTPEGDLIIASADDCLKILYTQTNEIQKITGLKSFISSIQIHHLYKEKLLQIWFADYYGQIHYFLKQTNLTTSDNYIRKSTQKLRKQEKQGKEKQNQLVMFESQLSRSIKITENGIKKIKVSNNMLLILDTQMNILIYDIVRDVQTLTGRSTN